MSRPGGVVRVPVAVQCADLHGWTTVTLVYDAADPCAVGAEFPPDDGCHPDGVLWEFDRELLAQGLRQPTGLDQVRVSPLGDVVLIEFTGPVAGADAPEGTFRGRFARDRVLYFLRRTYGLVRRGGEISEADVDRLIISCLEDAR